MKAAGLHVQVPHEDRVPPWEAFYSLLKIQKIIQSVRGRYAHMSRVCGTLETISQITTFVLQKHVDLMLHPSGRSLTNRPTSPCAHLSVVPTVWEQKQSYPRLL